jgi:hypothetical protein
MSAGILNEVDAIVDTLKPRFYLAEDVAVTRKTLQTQSTFYAERSELKPIVARYHDRIHEQVRSITEPVNAATSDFIGTYSTNLDALLQATTKSTGNTEFVAFGKSVTVETEDKAFVGISAWASALVAMASVLGAAFVQNRRSHFYREEV